MGRGRPKKAPKDKFNDLDSDFKDAVLLEDKEALEKRTTEIAMNAIKMKDMLKADPEVASAKEQLKNLMEPYREDFKAFKLCLEFIKQRLEDMGKL